MSRIRRFFKYSGVQRNKKKNKEDKKLSEFFMTLNMEFLTQINSLDSLWNSNNSLYYIIIRYSDGTVKLRNPNIELMDQDILYHLALGSGSHDLQEMFGDVKVSRDMKIQMKLFS
jgi:hypothetical protein